MLNQLGQVIETYPEPEDLTECCTACGVCVEGVVVHQCSRAAQRVDSNRRPVRTGRFDHLADPESDFYVASDARMGGIRRQWGWD